MYRKNKIKKIKKALNTIQKKIFEFTKNIKIIIKKRKK